MEGAAWGRAARARDGLHSAIAVGRVLQTEGTGRITWASQALVLQKDSAVVWHRPGAATPLVRFVLQAGDFS